MAHSAFDLSPLQRAERGRQAISGDFGHDEWVDAVDLDKLDFSSIQNCIVGQVYQLEHDRDIISLYHAILGRLGADDAVDEASLGFVILDGHEELKEAWRTVLAPLRAAN